MQAVIFGMLGISELHRRNASPVHICCASALKAKLAVDSADNESTNASVRAAWRIVLVLNVVMVASSKCPPAAVALFMSGPCLKTVRRTVTCLTQVCGARDSIFKQP